MAKYAAFIRGIMPQNPNMRNARLCEAFESLGFTGVKAVISSGNVIFESSSRSTSALEAKIEKALASSLGIKGCTMVRSKDDLQKIIERDPFKGKSHSRDSYLLATFMKVAPREVYTSLDVTKESTPDLMKDLEKRYGKDITSRTWKTVLKIYDRLTSK
jgi:uncharacterized protein (DUF1697 family)